MVSASDPKRTSEQPSEKAFDGAAEKLMLDLMEKHPGATDLTGLWSNQ